MKKVVNKIKLKIWQS